MDFGCHFLKVCLLVSIDSRNKYSDFEKLRSKEKYITS